MGKLWIVFRADLPERKKRFPSRAGAEKFAADLNFGEKNGILVATGPGPCQIEVNSLHFRVRTKHGPGVHGPPLWTGSMDYFHGPGPWTPFHGPGPRTLFLNYR